MFRRVKLLEGIKAVGTVIVAAFMDDDVDLSFPAEQCAVTMRAVIFGFSRSFITIIGLKSR